LRIIIAAIVGLAVAGCTEDRAETGFRAANSWALAAANPLGAPVDCVETSRIRSHIARDDRTIDFHLTDGTILRNRLPYGCPRLMQTGRFSYRTALPRLCSVDLITLTEVTGAAGPSCGLGQFQQVGIPPRPGALPAAR